MAERAPSPFSAVMIMTARGPARIIQEGGSQAFVLNPEKAKRHGYVVLVQNQHNGTWGGATEPHGMAFMIGKIRSVDPSPERPERFIVRIERYARIAVPIVWPGRNPIRYIDLETYGIDPAGLEWIDMPQPVEATTEEISEDEEGEPFAPEAAPVTETGPFPEFQTRIGTMLGIHPGRVRISIDA
ncbi:hypothetical protein J8J14_22535 [Roseomonas sp. SSH11]|uniref:Uncharacterized protein n=1 Tax=Pararoseomonas baculiformis TaxID=2820812 RepID=A0ABS4AKI3_9PROT|nr:hypothetical protein [Pararoseomonas baculiformis]MBP0447540.1 hypothetical protein [Pararoseomonas baculiformis]